MRQFRATKEIDLSNGELRTLSVLGERKALSRIEICIAFESLGWPTPGLLGVNIALRRLEARGFVARAWNAATIANRWQPVKAYLRTEKARSIERPLAGPTMFERIFLRQLIKRSAL